MDNKLVSLLIKVGMGLLLLVGLVLISNNLSFNSTDVEPVVDQEFYKETFELPTEPGKKIVEESIIHFDYVLDNDNGVVYDLSNNSIYEMEAFVSSNGETKTEKGTFKEGDVDAVLLNEYGLQNATGNSIVYAQWLMYGGLILILIFTVINIIKEPKRFIRLAIGIVLLSIITIICYNVVDTVGVGKVTQLDSYTDGSYQISAAGITMFLVLLTISGAMIVVSVVSGALRYFSK